MEKIIEAWKGLKNSSAVTPEVFFKTAFGFDLDESSRNHNQHLNIIKEFLSQKVGKEAYLDDRIFAPKVAYVKKDISKVTVFQKIQHVWNNNIGANLTVSDVQELVLTIFDVVVHRTMVSEMLRLVCQQTDAGYRTLKKGEKDKRKGGYVYSIVREITKERLELISKEYYDKRDSYKKKSYAKKTNRAPKVIVRRISNGPVSIFKPHNFIQVNGEIIVKISNEEAKRLEGIFVNVVGKLAETKSELTDTKKRMAKIIDENQELNQKLRVLCDGKVTSISESLDEIEKHL